MQKLENNNGFWRIGYSGELIQIYQPKRNFGRSLNQRNYCHEIKICKRCLVNKLIISDFNCLLVFGDKNNAKK